MLVEQAIFTSARTSHMSGYHLVARSPGISDQWAQQISRWCPTQSALLAPQPHGESLNYFPLGDDGAALTRTVYGGPEYSGRGELQAVTLILVLRRDQLAALDNNPLSLARTALTLGYLRLRAARSETLPAVKLPDRELLGIAAQQPAPYQADVLDETIRRLTQDERVAIAGIQDALPALDYILSRIAPPRRASISFSTALKPSSLRRFDLQFLPTNDGETPRQLELQNVHLIKSGMETGTK